MALVTLKEILVKKDASNYGIGAFNVSSIAMLMGALRAAEEEASPVIIQIAECRLAHSPLHLIGPAMVEAAKRATVPVCIHLDHGNSIEVVAEALEIGFSSVMFDGSQYPLAENIALTRKVRAMAEPYGASVEGEIGRVGGSEGGEDGVAIALTSVAEAVRFYEETKVDALAVSIGTAHGHYREVPQLNFARLREIGEQVACPLVLHGGSGLTGDDFRQCIMHKIRKVNIATASFESSAQKVRELLFENAQASYFQINEAVQQGTYENVKEHIEIFGSSRKA